MVIQLGPFCNNKLNHHKIRKFDTMEARRLLAELVVSTTFIQRIQRKSDAP